MAPSKVLLPLLIILLVSAAAGPQWGFFGHRRINRLAVFTLPAEMMPLFRGSVDYLSEHAVDPDKRRYATAHEAVRHYMDLDHWGRPPFRNLPKDYVTALLRHTDFVIIGTDTSRWRYDTTIQDRTLLTSGSHTVDIDTDTYRRLWYTTIVPSLRKEEYSLPVDSFRLLGLPAATEVRVEEEFSQHGILPYYLQDHHRRLTRAFMDRDNDRILQLAAEMGHYVADAHVPLHTTENYNGQLTGQEGIHAFWESRLPELFADDEYDYIVGQAEYLADPRAYYWDIVLTSHTLVDSVLSTERRLSEQYPKHLQYCTEERSGKPVNTQCAEYSRAWSEAMNGMVEERFRAAIRSVGSVWYSCWVDAGQPVIDLRPPTKRGFPLPITEASGPGIRTHE